MRNTGARQAEPPHEMYLSTRRVIEASISDSVDPFVLNLPPDLSPQSLNSILSSLHDLGPGVSFSLTENPDPEEEDEAPSKPIILSKIDAFPPDLCGDFTLSFSKSDIDIDGRYDSLQDTGLSALTQEDFYAKASGQTSFDSYLFALYAQRFLYRAMMDIVQHKGSPLVKSMSGYFSPNSVIKAKIVTNALIDLITELFGEYSLWNMLQLPNKRPEWSSYVGLLSSMIVNFKVEGSTLRDALKPFQPSSITELTTIGVTLKLRQMVTDPELFRIMSDVFPDRFMRQSFSRSDDLYQSLIAYDLVTVYPFIMVYVVVLEVINKKMEAAQAAEVITQLGLPSLICSKSIVTAVIDPVFQAIYELILNDTIPYLEMTAEQLNKIVEMLTLVIPIWQVTISKQRNVQPEVLSRLQHLLAKRGFEPKGLCFTWFGFLYDRNILHDSAFNTYIQMNCRNPEPGKNSVILEINSFLLTLIPNQFPDVSRDGILPSKPAVVPARGVQPMK